MIKKMGLFFLLIGILKLGVASDNDEVLFKIDNTEVKVSEFEYIYNKNNFNNKADYSEASLREYLNLYVNFRLKVNEAEAQGLDKDPKLLSELNVYQEQLYNSFYDKDVLKVLIDETSNRLMQDVSISHIFINSATNATAEKTIYDAYEALASGLSFADVAKKYSEDTYTKSNGGLLGYFTALQISFYDLETAAYNTRVGAYSKPIKTEIGYHIISVNDIRPARGKVRVGILKLYKSTDEQKNIQTAEKINTIYTELINGKAFNAAVLEYSEDANTKEYGGELPWFGISQYDPVFEEESFKIKNIGDMSLPFQTQSAWYIVKLIDKKTPQNLIDEKEDLIVDIKKSERYKIQRQNHIDNIIKKFGYELIQPAFDNFKTKTIDQFKAHNYKFDENEKATTILTIGKKLDISQIEFGTFISTNSFRYKNNTDAERFDKLFQSFLEEKIIDFHVVEYGKENKEYGSLLGEYRDGILLFALMEEKVWSKAVQDSVGLRNYFDLNKDNFKIPEKATIKKFGVSNKQSAGYLNKILKLNPELNNSQYLAKLEKKGISIVSEDKVIEKTDELMKSVVWAKDGLSFFPDGAKYAVYQTTSIIPEKSRAFEEAKGFAIAAYQDFLEKEWIKELKQKFTVSINESLLKKMIK